MDGNLIRNFDAGGVGLSDHLDCRPLVPVEGRMAVDRPFVKRLDKNSIPFLDPSWEDVEAAISELASEPNNIVAIRPGPPLVLPEGDHHMVIGGGKGGRYVVYLTKDNLEFVNLQNAGNVDLRKQALVNIGGQVGDYSETQLVDRRSALLAAEYYYQNGSPDPTLNWKVE